MISRIIQLQSPPKKPPLKPQLLFDAIPVGVPQLSQQQLLLKLLLSEPIKKPNINANKPLQLKLLQLQQLFI